MLLPGQVPPVTMDKLSMAEQIDAESIKLNGTALANGTQPDTNGKVHILVTWVNCRQAIRGLTVTLSRAS